jgi:hypothetical protein
MCNTVFYKIHWLAKQIFFCCVLKSEGDSYSFAIAESKCDNKIALSPTSVNLLKPSSNFTYDQVQH